VVGRWGRCVGWFGLVAAAVVAAPAGGAAATPDATPLPDALVGAWSRNVTQGDFRRHEIADRGFPTGRWRIVVKAGGAVDVYVPGGQGVDFVTRFAPRAGTLAIGDMPVCGSNSGRYRWTVHAARLSLRPISESACPARAALMTGVWTRGRT
jgi:hypothetical protein